MASFILQAGVAGDQCAGRHSHHSLIWLAVSPRQNTRGVHELKSLPTRRAWQHRAQSVGCQSLLLTANEQIGRGCSRDVVPQTASGVTLSTPSTAKFLGLPSQVRVFARDETGQEAELFRLGFVYKVVSSGLQVKNHFICWSRCFVEQNARPASRLGGVQSPGQLIRQQAPAPACSFQKQALFFSLWTPLPLKTFWQTVFLPAGHSRGSLFKDMALSHRNQNHPPAWWQSHFLLLLV
jgi:hypothetical protein